MTDPLALHVHRFLPAADPAGAPTLLLLHGTGGDENDLLPLAKLLAPQANVLSPRGNVLENGAPRFFRRLAEGVFDLDDLQRRTGELKEFLLAAAARYSIDLSRTIAVGFSNGANIAASLLLADGAIVPRAVLLRAMVPFSPEHRTDLSAVEVVIIGGKADPMIDPKNTSRLGKLLEERGATVELEWADGGHGLTQWDIAVAREAIERWAGAWR